ncbi:MAG: hypothetical protein ACI8XO_002667 [Verrucomicrobiales bacterium]|jgi:hypothetical protein
MDDVPKKLIRELELIQSIGHLLQKAGEADVDVTLSGWALEGAGRMIVDSASEIREALDGMKDAKPDDHHTKQPQEV